MLFTYGSGSGFPLFAPILFVTTIPQCCNTDRADSLSSSVAVKKHLCVYYAHVVPNWSKTSILNTEFSNEVLHIVGVWHIPSLMKQKNWRD
jgi:hypothetical protein